VADITERREVRVRGDESTFVFAAEPDEGRLVIREERGEDDADELCALTIADREELSGFLQGLRRVLGVDEGRAADSPPIDQRGDSGRGSRPALSSSGPVAQGGGGRAGGGAGEEEDRQAAIERARRRGQGNAFAAWTPDEERRLLAAVEEGRDLDEVAREHGRSRRAIELRIEKLRGS
jgi:hypothetical protein